MRAFLIDPVKRSISEIDIVVGDLVEIQKILRCNSVTTGVFRRLNGSVESGGDTLLVDDSYLRGYPDDDPPDDSYLRGYPDDDPPVWFQVDPGRSPLTSAAIPVLGLVIGCDQIGNYTDAKISMEELTKRIGFWPKAPIIE